MAEASLPESCYAQDHHLSRLYLLPSRFSRKVAVSESGCWIWTAGAVGGGYGQFSFGGKRFVAHRFAYERLVGAIPSGLQLDHLCFIKRCVNPAHLEPVSVQENVRRAFAAKLGFGRPPLTHCGHGHEYTPENTYWRPGTRERHCRTCKTIQAKNRKRR